MALIIEVKLGLLHRFFVFLFELFNFLCVLLMESFNLIPDLLVSAQLEVDLELVVLLQGINFRTVFLLLILQLFGEILVLFG
jgi:hypothetical protein